MLYELVAIARVSNPVKQHLDAIKYVFCASVIPL
ncbi:unnamed protein product [Kuraishia capsulata CBS 1993]|uniref:Uncharacterized protein n=1 Tax=Kuraishia capsulata CBS 1993 TaxID=1382522 RepID=W6MT52_9ASCO|nr:uncharacterized protein KUCA_T00004369001 [Kuraishia capsulata CBS 1993]CDK28387.1 unnamed protein product [Kuraishia capsulata CBS 1993]